MNKDTLNWEDWLQKLKDLAYEEDVFADFEDPALEEAYQDGDSVQEVLEEIRYG